MSKKLTSPFTVNELKGNSAFFKPAPTSKRHHDITKPRHLETKTSQTKFEKWRDVVESKQTLNTTLRLTAKEKESLEDFVRDLRRNHKIRTSMNELARLGFLYLIEDFEIKGDKSLLSKVKSSQ